MGLFSKVKNPFKAGKNIFDKVIGGVESIGDATLNVLSGGMIAQAEATKEAKKARDMAADQYSQGIAAAEAEAKRIADLEEERKRKLLLMGTQKPSTMVGGYLGIGGQAAVGKPFLG
jgi:hypothetical protein